MKDLFIGRIRDVEVQRQLIRAKANLDDTLQLALENEKGAKTSEQFQKLLPHNNAIFNITNSIRVKQEPTSSVQQFKNQGNCSRRGGVNRPNQRQNQNKPCYFCGNPFSLEHHRSCPASEATYNACKKKGHFAKVCNTTRRRVNMVQNEEMSTDQECNLIDVNGDTESEYGVMAIDVVQINNVELLKTAGGQPRRSLSIQLRSSNSFFYSTVYTGSPVSFLNKKTADILMKRIPNIKFKDIARHLLDVTYVDYNKKPIKLFGSLEIPITSKGWKIKKACFLVSENRTRDLLGLNLHEKLGIETVQRRPAAVSYAEEDEELDLTSKFWRDYFIKRYPNVFSRLGRSKNHKVFTNFKDPLVPIQVKGRKVPIHLQDRVTAEIKKLIKDKHIERLQKCTTDHFIAPIVLTAKKDGSIKLALNAKPMNAQIWQNKYQMPNMHELIDSAAQIITRDTPGEVWFPSLDLKYAFSQLPLSELTSSHCNFSIFCGEATGTYRFKTGFFGLMDMSTEFQKAMDCTLQGLEGVICYLDDILVVTKGRVEDHNVLVGRVMSRLNEEGWALKLSKCEFSVNKLVWLGYEIDDIGYAPKFSKIEAIKSLLPPKTLKQLRSFMGTLNHLQRFIPDLYKYTVAFRASLKTQNKKSFL